MSKKNIILMTVKPPEKSFLPVREKRIPLKIATLMSYLSDDGHNVTLIDNYLKYNDWENIVDESNVDYVAVYLTIECWAEAQVYLQKLNEMKNEESGKSFKLVVFGPQATFNTELIPAYVDFIIANNYERSFSSLFTTSEEQKVITGEPLSNVDDLKPPKWDYFIPDNNVYNSEYDLTESTLGDVLPVFDLLTAYGNQTSLNYCSSVKSCPDELFLMSSGKILEWVNYLVDTYQAKGIRFKDYNFAVDKARLEELCNKLIENNLDIVWQCSIKPGSVDLSTLSLMKKAGCEHILVPVESASQRILEQVGADFNVDHIKTIFMAAKKARIKTTAIVCYCLPEETEVDRKQTEVLLEQCKADFIVQRLFVGIPGSKLCEDAMKFPHRIDENGLIIPSQWETLAKKYLGRSFYSGNYMDVVIASNPIPELVFYKKKDYIEEKIKMMGSLPVKKKVYLYGAGKLAKSLVKKFKMEELNIKGLFDNNLSKSGRFRPTKFTVYHATEIKKLSPDYIFITMASKDESMEVKKAIMNDVTIDKKPEIYSMFYEQV